MDARFHEPMRGSLGSSAFLHQAKKSLTSAFWIQCSSKSCLKTKGSLFPKTNWMFSKESEGGFPLKRRCNADSLLSAASRPNSRGHCHLVAHWVAEDSPPVRWKTGSSEEWRKQGANSPLASTIWWRHWMAVTLEFGREAALKRESALQRRLRGNPRSDFLKTFQSVLGINEPLFFK